MIDPAKSLSPTQTRDELSSLLDRARQERFRLLDLLKESRQAVVSTAADVHTGQPVGRDQARDEVQKLILKVQQLNDAVSQRMEKLHATESRVKTRVDQLERLELKMANLAERFESLVSDAKQIEPVVAEAEARTQELRVVAEGLQEHSHEMANLVDTRLAEHTDEFNRRLDDHHEMLVSQQIKEFQSFSDAVNRQKQNHLDQLQRDLSEKRAEIMDQFEQQRDALTARFEQEKEDALIDAEQSGIMEVGELRKRLADMANEVLGDTEKRGQAALDQVREQVVTAMGRADEVSRSLRQRLDKSLTDHQTKATAVIAETDDDLLVRSQKLDERLAGLADLFDHQADQIIIDLKTRANSMLDNMAASLQTAGSSTKPQVQDDADTNEEQGPQLRVA